MTNCLLYEENNDYSESDNDDGIENRNGHGSDRSEDFDDDNFEVFDDEDDGNCQQSAPGKFALLDHGYTCMAETVVVEQQLPDILRAFRFPRIRELEILDNSNPNYDHYIFQENSDFKHLKRYFGSIDVRQPNLDAFKHLSNLETDTHTCVGLPQSLNSNQSIELRLSKINLHRNDQHCQTDSHRLSFPQLGQCTRTRVSASFPMPHPGYICVLSDRPHLTSST